MLQLSLIILEDAPSKATAWDSLSDGQRAELIEAMAKLIAKAATRRPSKEAGHD